MVRSNRPQIIVETRSDATEPSIPSISRRSERLEGDAGRINGVSDTSDFTAGGGLSVVLLRSVEASMCPERLDGDTGRVRGMSETSKFPTGDIFNVVSLMSVEDQVVSREPSIKFFVLVFPLESSKE